MAFDSGSPSRLAPVLVVAFFQFLQIPQDPRLHASGKDDFAPDFMTAILL